MFFQNIFTTPSTWPWQWKSIKYKLEISVTSLYKLWNQEDPGSFFPGVQKEQKSTKLFITFNVSVYRYMLQNVWKFTLHKLLRLYDRAESKSLKAILIYRHECPTIWVNEIMKTSNYLTNRQVDRSFVLFGFFVRTCFLTSKVVETRVKDMFY